MKKVVINGKGIEVIGGNLIVSENILQTAKIEVCNNKTLK